MLDGDGWGTTIVDIAEVGVKTPFLLHGHF
jgi:hypothetical protein